MGCNCKGGKKVIHNNLDNPNHIENAKQVVETIISVKDIQTLTDLDIVEIMGAYYGLYPSSSIKPTVEDAINQIKIGIEIYGTKYTRRR
jgi:cobyrinic acid a,c-diamide synthase